MARVLIAENDARLREKIATSLGQAGHHVDYVDAHGEILRKVSAKDFDVTLLDSSFTLQGNLDIVSFIKRSTAAGQIIILTDIDQIDTAVQAMRRGAHLYLVKPIKMEDLLFVVDGAVKNRHSSLAYKQYERSVFESIVGHSPKMQKVLDLVAKVAPTDSTILLLGESGTGKEIVAELIHQLSDRHDGAFVALNCAALPETLLESELFGYARGAFTGATRSKAGLFEAAAGGTIFLDEIGDIPLATQIKLLRVLQNKEIRRLGENKVSKVNVRIIAATNRDLNEAIAQKTFREDLFFRLNVIQIKIPPLRDRMEALPTLLRFFVDRFNEKFGKHITGVDRDAQFLLANYDYPGNVRELENIVEHAAIVAEGTSISAADLPDYLTATRPLLALTDSTSRDSPELDDEGDSFITLEEMEKRLIMDTLKKCGGNQTMAASKLRISRSTLWRKINKYGIHSA